MESEAGVVYTKPWVAELILDIGGYDTDKDLCGMRALEPSCGEGAFLVPMAERLCVSMKAHGHRPSKAKNSIRAFDLDEEKVTECRRKVAEALERNGWSKKESKRTAETWISQGDFILNNAGEEYDFVFGNPPYVRSADISEETRKRYMAELTTTSLGTDLFVGFIEKGASLLSADGKLCFICADRWMQNSYGKKLRKLILDKYNMDAILRMHETDAFEKEVSAYPAVILISRAPGKTLYADCSAEFDSNESESLARTVRCGKAEDGETYKMCYAPPQDPNGGPWMLSDPRTMAAVAKMNDRFRPIEETGVRIGIGIATGRDQAFITDNPGIAEEERMLPLLCRADLEGMEVPKEPKHWLANPWEDDGSLVDLEKYPKLKAYFESNRKTLENRHVAKTNSGAWYRTIDKVHKGLKETPKLMFADLSARSEPILDADGKYYPSHNMYWVTSDRWDLRVLGGLLLSEQAESVIDAYGVKMRGGTMRFQAQYLRLLRLPEPEELTEDEETRLREAFAKRDRKAATKAAEEMLGRCLDERENEKSVTRDVRDQKEDGGTSERKGGAGHNKPLPGRLREAHGPCGQ